MAGMELYGPEEHKEINDVLQTGALFRYGHEQIRKGHWKAREFEEEIRKFTGAAYAHAVSSGSTAVATMLAASGIGHGDEVIVPPFTFVAPVEAVFLAGGLPIFAELDETLCLSAQGIEEAITPRTKAVLLVHMCGAPADMKGIMEVCKKHNLVLLEDAGQALGATYNGKSVGLFGRAGSFSFDYFKIATCGEGGAVITDNAEVYGYMDQVSDHGHTHVGDNRGMEDHYVMGFNFRIGELNAAVGLAQMRKLPVILQANRKNKAYLKSKLSDIPGITFRKLTDENGDSATFLNFFFPDSSTAQKVFDQLGKDKVGGVAYWYKNMYHYINQWDHIKNLGFPAKLAIHDLGAPQDYNKMTLPRSEDIMSRMASIGIQATWTEDQLEVYADQLTTSIKKIL